MTTEKGNRRRALDDHQERGAGATTEARDYSPAEGAQMTLELEAPVLTGPGALAGTLQRGDRFELDAELVEVVWRYRAGLKAGDVWLDVRGVRGVRGVHLADTDRLEVQRAGV